MDPELKRGPSTDKKEQMVRHQTLSSVINTPKAAVPMS